MRAVALVAHPDDCVIFAWPFIEAHPEFEWVIVYLTYKETDARAKEVKQYWNKKGIVTAFMGHKDHYKDLETGRFNFWDAGLVGEHVKTCVEAINPDLILTHNQDGDYGHIHHMFVNQIANTIGKPKVYFASTFNYNVQYVVQTPIEVNELPLHKDVIEQFTDRNLGLYIVTPEAETLINNNNENINIR